MENNHIPYDTDAEEAVLGAIICHDAYPEISSALGHYHFSMDNMRVWASCKKSFNDYGKTSVQLVQDAMKSSKLFVKGDLERIEVLATKSPATVGKSLDAFIKRVFLNRERREATTNLYRAISEVKESEDPSSTIIKASEGLMISKSGRKAGTLKEWMEETEYMENFLSVKEKPMFSGILDLDQMTGGFHKGELSFIAGRPGGGKTTLALAFALFMEKNGFRPAFVSAEMGIRALLDRLLAMKAQRPVRLYRSGQVDMVPDSLASKSIMEGMGALSDLDMIFVKAHGLSPSEIRSALYPYIAKDLKPDILFVDYIQLLKSGNNREKRNDELGEITASMMQIANEHDCHVCCLSQLSREGGKVEPQLHHLRDSGTLEQDANQVIMVWRDSEQPNMNLTSILLKVAKNRDGLTGTCKANIDFSTYTIKE